MFYCGKTVKLKVLDWKKIRVCAGILLAFTVFIFVYITCAHAWAIYSSLLQGSQVTGCTACAAQTSLNECLIHSYIRGVHSAPCVLRQKFTRLSTVQDTGLFKSHGFPGRYSRQVPSLQHWSCQSHSRQAFRTASVTEHTLKTHVIKSITLCFSHICYSITNVLLFWCSRRDYRLARKGLGMYRSFKGSIWQVQVWFHKDSLIMHFEQYVLN